MKFLRNNGLSLVLAALFFIFWFCQAWSGWHVHNDNQILHGLRSIAFSEYLVSGHFWQATGENWESEFLQMGAYVVLTCFLFQKGSAESKDPDDPEKDGATDDKKVSFFYRNSLSIAFIVLFAVSFSIHAFGGLCEENAERAEHGLPPQTVGEFLAGSEFWFQSFQNWQSEFLAVLSIVTLSIWLRQHGSPESKAIDDSNSKTGK